MPPTIQRPIKQGRLLGVGSTDVFVNLCYLYLLLFDHSLCSNVVVFLIVYVGLYVAAWEKKREQEEEGSLLQKGMYQHIYCKLLNRYGVASPRALCA